MREFLGIEDLKIPRLNEGAEKEYAAVYRAFKSMIEIPAEYLDRMYGSRMIRHFYTETERASMRAKWDRTCVSA